MITVYCDCGKAYRAKDSQKGKTIKCKKCGSAIRIPGKPEEKGPKKKKKKKKETSSSGTTQKKKKSSQQKQKTSQKKGSSRGTEEQKTAPSDRSRKTAEKKSKDKQNIGVGGETDEGTTVWKKEEEDSEEPEDLEEVADAGSPTKQESTGTKTSRKRSGRGSSRSGRIGSSRDTQSSTSGDRGTSGSRSYRGSFQRKKELPGLSIFLGMLGYFDVFFLMILSAGLLFVASLGQPYVDAFWKGSSELIRVAREEIRSQPATDNKTNRAGSSESDQLADASQGETRLLLQESEQQPSQEDSNSGRPEPGAENGNQEEEEASSQNGSPEQSGSEKKATENSRSPEDEEPEKSGGFVEQMKGEPFLLGFGILAGVLALGKFFFTFFFLLKKKFGMSGIKWFSLIEIVLFGLLLFLGGIRSGVFITFLSLNVINFLYFQFAFDDSIFSAGAGADSGGEEGGGRTSYSRTR